MSTFPLPTLAAVVGPNGITAPSFADILASLQASFWGIYGSDAVLTPDSQDGQLLAIFAAAINDSNQVAIAVYNSFPPGFSQGAALSAMVKINGIQRQSASQSFVTLTLTGVAGTVLSSVIAKDANGYLWQVQGVVTIPLSGTIDVTAVCQTFGAIAAAPGTITIIYTPQPGWQSVTNAASAQPGAPVETDAALRARQKISVALPAITPLESIISAVANVAGVTRYQIYDNDTNAPDSNGVPAHSICVVAEGGAGSDIAGAIASKKSPGTGTYGSTTVNVTDPSGVVTPINYYGLTYVVIYVNVAASQIPGAGYVASTQTAIQNAIVDFINGLAIGEDVNYYWLIAVAGLINEAIGQTFKVTSLTLGLSLGTMGTADIAVPFNQAAQTVAAKVTVTVT